MVFSAVQLIIEGARKLNRGGYSVVKVYLANEDAKNAIREFKPAQGVKAIPFIMIKYGMSRVLFALMKIIRMQY